MSILGLLVLFYAGYLFLKGNHATHYNHVKLHPKKQPPHIAVLIAARDESRVIEGLLRSLKAQTVPLRPEDVYVIVETMEDPTVKICEKYHNSVIVRRHPANRQRKGYALDEAVKQILAANKHYDLYFVFDADNVVDKHYMSEMLTNYYQGYEIATGYRNSKNGNTNVIAAVSSLTFSMINVMSNRRRAEHGSNIIFSGTGFYVVGDLVEEWRGWPFHSLTEDYEMSLYATLHGISTYYNENAIFYDEQPTKYRQTVKQRIRWIRGYFSARQKYIPLMRARKRGANYGSIVKECIGVRPAIWAIIGVLLIMIGVVIELVALSQAQQIWWLLLIILAGIYIVLVLITLEMVKRERYHFSRAMKLKAIFFNPIYLVTYIPCAIVALLKHNVTWDRIEHGK